MNVQEIPPSRLTPPRDHTDGVKKCWKLIKRAVRTHDALPDSDRRFRRPLKSCLPNPVYTAEEVQAQIDFAEKLRLSEKVSPIVRFRPTPRDVDNMLPALGWLCWLNKQPGGTKEVELLLALSRGVSWWKLCSRHRKSERTLERWHAAAVAAIYCRFDLEVWSLDLPREAEAA